MDLDWDWIPKGKVAGWGENWKERGERKRL